MKTFVVEPDPSCRTRWTWCRTGDYEHSCPYSWMFPGYARNLRARSLYNQCKVSFFGSHGCIALNFFPLPLSSFLPWNLSSSIWFHDKNFHQYPSDKVSVAAHSNFHFIFVFISISIYFCFRFNFKQLLFSYCFHFIFIVILFHFKFNCL